MNQAIETIWKLQKTNSSNEKLEILKEGINEELYIYLKYTNNDTKFGINEKTMMKVLDINSLQGYEDIGEWIQIEFVKILNHNITYDYLNTDELEEFFTKVQKLSGNKLIQFLQNNLIYSNIALNQKVQIVRTLLKNLRIGMSTTQINKILKDTSFPLIDTFIVQLAKKVDDKEWSKIPYPNYTEIKYDGIRCIASIRPIEATKNVNLGLFTESNNNIQQKVKVTLYSRQNKDITLQFPEIVKALEDWSDINSEYNATLDGEIIDTKGFNDLQKRLGRKPENITYNPGLEYNVFDLIDYNSKNFKTKTFDYRLATLIQCFNWTGSIKLSEGQEIETEKDLKKFYKQCLEQGYEGAVVKDYEGLYALKKRDERKGMWKIKPENDCDCTVINWDYGSGRLNDVVGNLYIVNEEEKIKCHIGTGMTDADRKELTEFAKVGKLVGKTAEIKYGELSQEDDEGYKSLRWPVFVCIREDK